MQLRGNVHYTLFGMLPASRRPAVQEGLQLHDLLLPAIPLAPAQRPHDAARRLRRLLRLRQHFDQDRLVLRRNSSRPRIEARRVTLLAAVNFAYPHTRNAAGVAGVCALRAPLDS